MTTHSSRRFLFLAAACFLASLPTRGAAAADKLEFESGDHISLVGNVLAERTQHDGWLETLIQAHFPGRELAFRNLSRSGDEIDTWHRTAGFGSRDEWLARVQTDVVFAFYGYNESFAGPDGLDAFREKLADFVTHARGQNYNGRTPPRVVLFSPIAFENHHTANLPDGRLYNERLAVYTQAMADVAAATGAVFVDLFHPTLALFESDASDEPLTLNGLYLTAEGDRAVAEFAVRELFADTLGAAPAAQTAPANLEKIRQAVIDKDYHWFQRYRTTDGYNIYGGRADEIYEGITNRVVMQREMEIIDVMTANRDAAVWAAAQGRDLAVDDSNVPPFIDVPTNSPGTLPDGKYEFLGGQEAIGKMTVPEGMVVELVGSEEKFPELINPVQMAFDPQGRLWVASWKSYPHWKPGAPFDDKLLILVDEDGDGRADRCKTFATNLPNPTGFEFWGGGVIVACAPDLIFLKDTDGDDVADVRERILDGIDSGDSHHSSNSFVLDPGGALYFQEGTFHRTQIENVYGPPVRNNDAAVWRFDPRTWKIERYVPFDFANPHGHVFDRWGQGIVTDGTGANPYHDTLFSGFIQHPAKHPAPPQVYQQPTRPCSGTEILSSAHFPPEYQDNFLVANVIGIQGILRFRIEDQGSTLTGVQQENLITSTDPNFRPVDIEIGPDGAVYFTDWQNPLIGHLQHHIRDPNRDVTHGRVYRIRMVDRPLLVPPKIADQPIEDLLELLKAKDNRVRYRARIELSDRNTQQVVTTAQNWIARLDPNDPDYQHHLMEGLWLHQQHNVVNEELLRRMLASPEFHARAAAVRVLCNWRDRVADSLALVKAAAADEQPLVRLEAVRAASFFTEPDAIEAVIIAASLPTDPGLDYTIKETKRTLDPIWQKAIAAGQTIHFSSDLGMEYVTANVSVEALLGLPPGRAVYREIMLRDGVSDERRRQAANALASLEDKSPLGVVIDLVASLDVTQQRRDAAYDLIRQLASYNAAELSAARPALAQLAVEGRSPLVRQIGLAMLVTADGSPDATMRMAQTSSAVSLDLVSAVPLVADPSLQASFYPWLRTLLAADGPPSDDNAAAARREAAHSITYIRGQEGDAFAAIAPLVLRPRDRDAAIQALLRIPDRFWPLDQAGPLADQVVAYVASIPANLRTEPAALDAVQLGERLAAHLPAERAADVRRSLGDLAVRVVRIGTLPHRMAFDQDRLVVQAKKPMQIYFENSDLMPHNLAITLPGSLEEVGHLADAYAQAPDAPARQYIPPTDLKILLSSRLVRPGESQMLYMIAPYWEGVYPFVCTYPGHWRRMYGALYVVNDLDAYLADPEKYLAEHNVPIRDPMLEHIRPRTEWKLEDLAPSVASLSMGRSFAQGKQMFQVAACVSCHKLNDAGVAIGPDLAQLDAKLGPGDILKEILAPSEKINEKFQSYAFQLTSGRVITGLVTAETPQAVTVVDNPLAKTEPVVIPTADIAERSRSAVSLMPNGLLDRLSYEEVLDLVAYISARGHEDNMLFQPEGEHEH